MTSLITGVSIVCSTVWSLTDQIKHQSFASLAFVTGGFPSQRASNAEMFPFDDVITTCDTSRHVNGARTQVKYLENYWTTWNLTKVAQYANWKFQRVSCIACRLISEWAFYSIKKLSTEKYNAWLLCNTVLMVYDTAVTTSIYQWWPS